MIQTVLTHLSYDDNRKSVMVRSTKWNDLDYTTQAYLLKSTDFSIGQTVYQRGGAPIGEEVDYWSGYYPTLEEALLQLPWQILDSGWCETQIVDQTLYDLACTARKEQQDKLNRYQEEKEEKEREIAAHKQTMRYLTKKFIEATPLTKKKEHFEWSEDNNTKHTVLGHVLYYKGKSIGLGIYKTENDSYIITHLATGFSVGSRMGKLKDAVDFCSLIATCTDWTQTEVNGNDYYYRSSLWYDF